ncbi:MAG: sulfopyruvate decarboxylase subunit alpha [Thermodesulfovibrio sp.]|nr:sulfopyruvate decarboxylase subunit alpha [Thermodesulfovibrio sp.]
MFNPEAELISIMQEAGTDFTASLPCEKIKTLLEMLGDRFPHLPLTREEEGVGICAGAALAGKHPAMFVQSSGIGNMLNALLSLTQFYELPLALFISQRGIYKERIAAQLPVGQRLPGMLRGAGIGYSVIGSAADFKLVRKKLAEVYRKNIIHAFLLSPAIWEGSEAKQAASGRLQAPICIQQAAGSKRQAAGYKPQAPRYTRYEILEIIAPWLKGKAVVCNLGIPSKELYAILNQPSNFYMLGSMGMVTPIGLGISLTSDKEVVVIDGDGSILMNPGTLATVAFSNPKNLTIIGIDNSSYGSTGNQQTLTGKCVDLALVAEGFGMHNSIKAATKKELIAAMKLKTSGPKFIHALSVSGNSDAPNIPIGHIEIKEQVWAFLAK